MSSHDRSVSKRSRIHRIIYNKLAATDKDFALFTDNPSFLSEKGKKFIFNLDGKFFRLACVTNTSWIQVPVEMAWASLKFRTGDTYGTCILAATANRLDVVVGSHRISSIRFAEKGNTVYICVDGQLLDFEKIVNFEFFAQTNDYIIDIIDGRIVCNSL